MLSSRSADDTTTCFGRKIGERLTVEINMPQKDLLLTFGQLKDGTHYTTFAQIYNLNKLTLVAESQSQSADLS